MSNADIATAVATSVYAGLTLAILGVLIVAAWYAKGQVSATKQALQDAAKTRHGQFMLHLGERWTSLLLMESRKRTNELGEGLSAKLLEPNVEQKEEFYYLVAVAIFFEDLGNAVKKEWVTLQEADDFFGPSISRYYRFYKSYIESEQKHKKDPRILQYFRELHEKLQAMAIKK